MSLESQKIDGVVAVVFKTSSFGLTQFLKKKEFNNIKLETFSQIWVETTLFLLHFCDREIFSVAYHSKRDIILEKVLSKVSEALERHDDKLLEKFYGKRTDQNLDRYFNYLSKASFSINFTEAYKERQMEYQVCKEWLPGENGSFEKTLVREFSKKINSLVDQDLNIRIIGFGAILASEMIKVCKECVTPILSISDGS
jgi:TM2 domain-containing membrane protein YozV